ncbi:MAG: exosortase system-associated protein, TIGR04073 family [Verrucomicrobia bacterium]|nr:exosortase system-associated protein, TIGR04073 family [Verrucomicrobiota bacterium]
MRMRSCFLVGGLVAVLACLSSAPNASADDALRRFGRGLSNLVWGWTDVPLTMHQEDAMNGPAAAVTYGVVKGVAKLVSRTAVGVYEAGFFYLPFPDAYWPIIKPEFPLEQYNLNVLMYE